MSIADLTLETVFAKNQPLLERVMQYTRVRSIHELLMYSTRMIGRISELSGYARNVNYELECSRLAARGTYETPKDAAIRLYGSLLSAPVEVLNFTVLNDEPVFRPLQLIYSAMDEARGKKILVSNIMERAYTDKDSFIPSELDSLTARLEKWEL